MNDKPRRLNIKVTTKCNLCRSCLELCPQGAIVERIPVSAEELTPTVANLKQQTDALLERIERLWR